MAVVRSRAVTRAITEYKRLHPSSSRPVRSTAQRGIRGWALGGRIARMSEREQDLYYAEVRKFRDALDRAEELIEWP